MSRSAAGRMRGLVSALCLGAVTGSANLAWAGDLPGVAAAEAKGDDAAVVQILQPLAKRGDADAQLRLGGMYYQGKGVTQDLAEAARWFSLAATQGNADAQDRLGLMYGVGQGVTQNLVEQAKWYRLAALQGNTDAQYNLGWIYSNGLAFARDYIRAYIWFDIAAASGSGEAAKKREMVAGWMTLQQLSEAQKLARDCKRRDFKRCD